MCWFALLLSVPYCLLLLVIYKHLRGIKPFESAGLPGVSVSVVTACRNEAENIQDLLSDIADQNYPPDKYEVIIIDDNSTDNTFRTASEYTGIKNLATIRNKGRGKKEAIKTGVSRASGELIIATDGDCRAGPEWISSIAQFYDKYKPDLIICPVTIEAGQGFVRIFQELEFLSLQGITAGTAAAGFSTMCNGANMAFTRKIYTCHAGNLHPEIDSGDDIFLLHSIKKDKNAKIRWLESHKALVTASPADTIRAFLIQRKRWISKSRAYRDIFTIILAAVTFAITVAQAGTLILAIINYRYALLFLMVFLLKSVPDFLILRNTTRRYGREPLMKWFLPSQIIYPFYVFSVALLAAAGGKKPAG